MSSSSGLKYEKFLIPLEEIKRSTENFNPKCRIGGGGFGSVYKGNFSERWQNRTVAIKRLDPKSYQGEKEFHNELNIISSFHHENILSFLGYCDQEKEMIIIYTFASKGSLDQHLEDPNKMHCMTWTDRLKICIGAARGLNHLHSGVEEHRSVIHRDVKSANILLDENLVPKVCDFGLSKLGAENQQYTSVQTKVAGTQYYLDPNYQESHILRKDSDVYSFGVVLFEMLSGTLVYQPRSVGDQRQVLMQSVRLYHQKEPKKLIDPAIKDQIRSLSLDMFQEIAYQCVSHISKERPTLETVINKLEEALAIQESGISEIESILRMLGSVNPYHQKMAVADICVLTKSSTHYRTIFGNDNAVKLLQPLITAPDSQTQEYTMTALSYISMTCNIQDISDDTIYVLSESSTAATREKAAVTILNLYRFGIHSANYIIRSLMSVFREGSLKGKKDATITFFNICAYGPNIEEAVSAGIIPYAVELLKDTQSEMKDEALDFLAELSTHLIGRRLVTADPEVLPLLVEIVGSGSTQGRCNAIKLLLKRFYRNKKKISEAQELGLLGKLEISLRDETICNSAEARRLLEMIESYIDQD